MLFDIETLPSLLRNIDMVIDDKNRVPMELGNALTKHYWSQEKYQYDEDQRFKALPNMYKSLRSICNGFWLHGVPPIMEWIAPLGLFTSHHHPTQSERDFANSIMEEVYTMISCLQLFTLFPREVWYRICVENLNLHCGKKLLQLPR